MSNVKISALPAGTALVDTDTLPVVRAGVTTGVNTGTLVADVATAKTNITTLQNQTVFLPVLTPLDQSAWTWFNQGTATVNQAGNIVTLLTPGSLAGTNLRGRLRGSYPTAPFTLIVVVRPWFQVAGAAVLLDVIGLTVTDGTKHKILVGANFNFNTAAGPSGIWVGKYASATSATSATVIDAIQIQNSVVYLKLVDDNTNQTFSYSLDGQQYIQVLQETRTTFLTPSDIGIVTTNQAGTQRAGGSVLSWALA